MNFFDLAVNLEFINNNYTFDISVCSIVYNYNQSRYLLVNTLVGISYKPKIITTILINECRGNSL